MASQRAMRAAMFAVTGFLWHAGPALCSSPTPGSSSMSLSRHAQPQSASVTRTISLAGEQGPFSLTTSEPGSKSVSVSFTESVLAGSIPHSKSGSEPASKAGSKSVVAGFREIPITKNESYPAVGPVPAGTVATPSTASGPVVAFRIIPFLTNKPVSVDTVPSTKPATKSISRPIIAGHPKKTYPGSEEHVTPDGSDPSTVALSQMPASIPSVVQAPSVVQGEIPSTVQDNTNEPAIAVANFPATKETLKPVMPLEESARIPISLPASTSMTVPDHMPLRMYSFSYTLPKSGSVGPYVAPYVTPGSQPATKNQPAAYTVPGSVSASAVAGTVPLASTNTRSFSSVTPGYPVSLALTIPSTRYGPSPYIEPFGNIVQQLTRSANTPYTVPHSVTSSFFRVTLPFTLSASGPWSAPASVSVSVSSSGKPASEGGVQEVKYSASTNSVAEPFSVPATSPGADDSVPDSEEASVSIGVPSPSPNWQIYAYPVTRAITMPVLGPFSLAVSVPYSMPQSTSSSMVAATISSSTSAMGTTSAPNSRAPESAMMPDSIETEPSFFITSKIIPTTVSVPSVVPGYSVTLSSSVLSSQSAMEVITVPDLVNDTVSSSKLGSRPQSIPDSFSISFPVVVLPASSTATRSITVTKSQPASVSFSSSPDSKSRSSSWVEVLTEPDGTVETPDVQEVPKSMSQSSSEPISKVAEPYSVPESVPASHPASEPTSVPMVIAVPPVPPIAPVEVPAPIPSSGPDPRDSYTFVGRQDAQAAWFEEHFGAGNRAEPFSQNPFFSTLLILVLLVVTDV